MLVVKITIILYILKKKYCFITYLYEKVTNNNFLKLKVMIYSIFVQNSTVMIHNLFLQKKLRKNIIVTFSNEIYKDKIILSKYCNNLLNYFPLGFLTVHWEKVTECVLKTVHQQRISNYPNTTSTTYWLIAILPLSAKPTPSPTLSGSIATQLYFNPT